MAKTRKMTQRTLFSCFNAQKPLPNSSSKFKKLSQQTVVKSITLTKVWKFDKVPKVSKSSPNSINPLQNLKSSKVVLTTVRASQGVGKKRAKKAIRKSQISKSRDKSPRNLTLFDFTLSSRETEAPSEAHNLGFKDQRRSILTKDIQMDLGSNCNTVVTKIQKRRRSLLKTSVFEQKRRKTSASNSSTKKKPIRSSSIQLKSNETTLNLNIHLSSSRLQKEDGIQEIRSFQWFKESDIFNKSLEKYSKSLQKDKTEDNDSEDDCDTENGEIERIRKLCVRRLRATIDSLNSSIFK